MEAVIQAADQAVAPIDETTLGGSLVTAAPDRTALTPSECLGAFSELAAWRFARPWSGIESAPWGIYWGPSMSGTSADGAPFFSPDVAEVNETVLAHWLVRASTAKHPVIRARYADLSWEIGRYLRRPAKNRLNTSTPPLSLDISISLAQCARAIVM